jgi:hypothetical protein
MQLQMQFLHAVEMKLGTGKPNLGNVLKTGIAPQIAGIAQKARTPQTAGTLQTVGTLQTAGTRPTA